MEENAKKLFFSETPELIEPNHYIANHWMVFQKLKFLILCIEKAK
jgi:hypothetical protein